MPQTVHLLSLPHTATTREYTWCAYTEKVRKFADLLTDLGHPVYLYASAANESSVHELVPIVGPDDWEQWWPGEDWSVNVFPDWSTESPHWTAYNTRTIKEMADRIEPGHIIAATSGYSHKPISDAFLSNPVIEWAVGYEGTFTNKRVFESYAWQSNIYGRQSTHHGIWYDAVIPNWFQEPDFLPTPNPTRDYLLFIGRRITAKGIHVAGQVAHSLGIPLKVAGQGTDVAVSPGTPGVEYLGVVRRNDRAELYSNAIATLVPTYYIEPFGGVAVESMLCGTPAITSDWGAFPETVNHGVSGFRCRSFEEFCEAVRRAHTLNSAAVRAWAISRYSHDAVKPLWQRYFDRLAAFNTPEGWYGEHSHRSFLNSA